MDDFHLKQGDTSPALNATLTDNGGIAVDISGAAVRFHMAAENAESAKIDALATIVSAADGQVKYLWQSADVDTVGIFNGEFEVTYSDGSIETFPNNSHIKIIIADDLA